MARVFFSIFLLLSISEFILAQRWLPIDIPELLPALPVGQMDEASINSASANQLSSIFKDNPQSAIEKIMKNNNTNKCATDLISFITGLQKGSLWALSMLDSYGKIGSGILKGNLNWPGSFGECISVIEDVSVLSNSTNGTTDPFHGQYCLASYPGIANSTLTAQNVLLKIGICVPDSCSNSDLEDLLNIFHANLTVFCEPSSHDIWADYKAVICIIFCIITVSIILTATVYDIYCQRSSLTYVWMPRSKDMRTPSTDGKNDDSVSQTDPSVSINDEAHLIQPLKTQELGICSKIFLTFSMYTNATKLFNMNPLANTLPCLNGIRVFSMLWIILGHTYMIGAISSDNVLDALTWATKFVFLFISGAQFAVDSFFVLSGLLVTYLYLKEHERTNGQISWIRFYLHRYLRLTPVYAVVLFLFENYLSKYYITGPFWPLNGFNGDNCNNNWWMNLLYINNFKTTAVMCMGHTWYLANDTQFYIISPLILILLIKRYKIGLAFIAGFILTNWLCVGLIVTIYDVSENLVTNDLTKQFDYIYDKPYCRIAAYMIGMACGYLLHKMKCQAKINKFVVAAGWLVAIALSSTVMFGIYKSHMNLNEQALYMALSRTAWSLALAWMIFACCNGYGGFIHSILSWPLWQPLGRLTYATYLIHLVILRVVFLSAEVAPHFGHTAMITSFLAASVISYFAAIFLSLCFEAPILGIEKIFTR